MLDYTSLSEVAQLYMKQSLLLALALFPLFAHPAFSQEKPLQLRAAIQLSSVASEGSYDLPSIAATAKANGISVVIITDRDLMKWEYGVWPLRNIFKKTVRRSSLFTYGIKQYLSYLEQIQQKFPEVLLIAGVESAPHYFWQGSPIESAALQEEKASGRAQALRRKLGQQKGAGKDSAAYRNLRMYNWHRHILTVGLEKHTDYARLPIVGNPRGLRKGFNPLALWPVILIALAAWLFFAEAKIPKGQKIIAVVLAAIGLLFFFNNWPFFKLSFDQYHDSGNRPYQEYINYVNRKGGLTFWSHPELDAKQFIGGVDFVTAEHSASLAETDGYTGYCVFPHGSREIGKPKGLWDELLLEYCQGVRNTCPWAIAGLAFEDGNLRREIKQRQTVILTGERSERAVVDALRNGKMYALEGYRSADFRLNEFSVADAGGRVKGIAGDTVKIDGKPRLHISGGFADWQDSVEIRVIRDGNIFQRYILETPFNIVCTDEKPPQENTKSYYRLEIVNKGVHLISNPIFVER